MSVALLLLTTILAADGPATPVGPSKGPTPPTMGSGGQSPPSPTRSPPASGKLAPAVAKEMTESIVAVNKALGLESWPSHGATPCVDRGGQGITAKSVTAEDTRKCASTALEKNFSELGQSFVLAIPMVSMGPMTVIALGIGENEGWGAYSCDPQRKCTPVKVGAPSKWGKRMVERKARACNEATTLWFPENQKACEATTTTAAAPPAPAPAPPPK